MLRRLPADDGSSSRNSVAWWAGSYYYRAALAVAGLAPTAGRDPAPFGSEARCCLHGATRPWRLAVIQLRRLRQPVRRFQLDRGRGKVEPAALKEQPVLPAALFRAEEQERALGIIGSPRRSLSSADGRLLL